MTQAIADRIAEIRRAKKRPAQSIANWIARERRRGHGWLADSIAAQAGVGPIVNELGALNPTVDVHSQKAHYWWQDD